MPALRSGKRMLRAGLLAALCAALLTGCAKEAVFDGSRVTNEKGFSMEYRYFDAQETAKMSMNEGEALCVAIAQAAGSVDLAVRGPGGETVYQGKDQKNAEFKILIPETGDYVITLTGHRAKGSVSVLKGPGEAE